MAQADDSEAGAVWLDLEHEQLWRGDQTLHLRPKSLALLRYLVGRAGRVVSKDELVQAVWLSAYAVSAGALRPGAGGAAVAVASADWPASGVRAMGRRRGRGRRSWPCTLNGDGTPPGQCTIGSRPRQTPCVAGHMPRHWAPPARPGTAADAAGHPRAPPAGTGVPTHPGAGVDRHYGMGAEVGATYARAQALCQQVGDVPSA